MVPITTITYSFEMHVEINEAGRTLYYVSIHRYGDVISMLQAAKENSKHTQLGYNQ